MDTIFIILASIIGIVFVVGIGLLIYYLVNKGKNSACTNDCTKCTADCSTCTPDCTKCNPDCTPDGITTFNWDDYAQLLSVRYSNCNGQDMSSIPNWPNYNPKTAKVASDSASQAKAGLLTEMLSRKSVPIECSNVYIFNALEPDGFWWSGEIGGKPGVWTYIPDMSKLQCGDNTPQSDQDLAYIRYQLLDNGYPQYVKNQNGCINNYQYKYFNKN